MGSKSLSDDVRAGRVLYGNDFTGSLLTEWFASEQEGYYALHTGYYADRADGDHFTYEALNWAHGAPLRGERWEVCLAMGPADGQEFPSLGFDVGRIIAIEPAKGFWSDKVGGIPAEYRVPTLDGTIKLPDASVDLVISLGVLHHIPNVEYVISELARVLKPGGRMLIREPIASLGDFTKPRPGMTANERGIPVKLMRGYMEQVSLSVDDTIYASCAIPQVLARVFKLKPFRSPVFVSIDRAMSHAMAWNNRYWRKSFKDKIAPAMAAYIVTKQIPNMKVDACVIEAEGIAPGIDKVNGT